MKAVGVIIFSENNKSILLSKRSQREESEAGTGEKVGGKKSKLKALKTQQGVKLKRS